VKLIDRGVEEFVTSEKGFKQYFFFVRHNLRTTPYHFLNAHLNIYINHRRDKQQTLITFMYIHNLITYNKIFIIQSVHFKDTLI